MGAGFKGGDGTQSTKGYEVAEGGMYPARCFGVVELGTHPNTHPQAKPGDTKEEIMLLFELDELMEDGRPFSVNWRGTNSLGDKASLKKLLEAWRNQTFTPEEKAAFQVEKVLDKCCQVNVSKEVSKKDPNKTFNKVLGVTPLGKGQVVPPRVSELVNFGIGDIGTPEWDKLWPWVQKIVLESKEGKEYLAEHPGFGVKQAETPHDPADDGGEPPF